MKAFTVLEGVAAPLLRPNINTDIIIRIERLRDLERDELGPYAFESWRYRRDGTEDPAFVLNKPQYREARIMIGGENFACGSSREAAVWALQSFGIRCVIAPSFGPIFFTTSLEMPASFGVQGPGEMTTASGLSASISAMVISSLRFTTGSTPNSPKYWTRL